MAKRNALARVAPAAVATTEVLNQMRSELVAVSSPVEALDVAERAARAKRMFEAIGRSVEECNQFGEIYLCAYWKFGDFVKDNPEGRPKKLATDGQYPGTVRQRKYGKQLRTAVKQSDIPDYIKFATEKYEAASVAGCLEWIAPGHHGNLKGEYEWYTPEAIMRAVRAVMGGIDLDPSSSDQANVIVQAAQIFTEDENGLAQPWHGRVFLNPPFAHPTVKYFAEKLLESVDAAQVQQAVWLSNACVDVEWWQSLAAKGIVCCHRGRVKFYGPDGRLQPPTLGQTIIYLGPNEAAFRAAFEPFGVVLS
jgi:hypothetical protein